MVVHAREADRTKLGTAEVSLDERPPRLRVGPPGSERDLFLDWERAIDDGGHLRKCILCGCESLHRTRSLPRVTPIVLVLGLTIVAVGLAGYGTPPLLVVSAIAASVIDLAFLLLGKVRLACYRCRSTFTGMPIARYHRWWDARTQRRVEAHRHASAGSS